VVNSAIEAGKEEPEDRGVDVEASGGDTKSNLPHGHTLVPVNELTEIGRESRKHVQALRSVLSVTDTSRRVTATGPLMYLMPLLWRILLCTKCDT